MAPSRETYLRMEKLRVAIRERFAEEGAFGIAEEHGVAHRTVTREAKLLGVKLLHQKRSMKNQGLTNRIDASIREKYRTEGTALIAAEFGVTQNVVKKRAFKLGVTVYKHEELDKAIRDRFEVEGPAGMAQEFGVQADLVTRRGKQLGLKWTDRYKVQGAARAESSTSVNIHYFDEWSPSMAYTLGYIWADGSVTNSGHSLRFGLSTVDEHILLDILADMQSTAKVTRRPMIPKNEQGILVNPVTAAAVCSAFLVRTLIEKHGVPPRKSYVNPEFPSVPDEMMPHFARGVFDGDGCVSVSHAKNHARASAAWLGSGKFIQGLQKAIVRLTGLRALKIHRPAGLYEIRWSAKADLHKLHDWLYQGNPSLFLKRKKESWTKALLAIGPPETGRVVRDKNWTLEQLNEWRQKAGTWMQVAEQLDVPFPSFWYTLTKLRLAAGEQPRRGPRQKPETIGL